MLCQMHHEIACTSARHSKGHSDGGNCRSSSAMRRIIALLAVLHEVSTLRVASAALRPSAALRTRCSLVMDESEMAYLKRMADTKDASKSAEWNAAQAAMEKAAPIMVLGRPVGEADLSALTSAISDALAAGVDYNDIRPFEKTAKELAAFTGEEYVLSPEAVETMDKLKAERDAEEDKVRDVIAERQKMMFALGEMGRAMPTMIFGKVVGKVDLVDFRAKIDAARAAGAEGTFPESMKEAEDAYKQAGGR